MINERETFQLKGEYIELYKLIKVFSLAGSGGEAKHLIDQGLVRVNDEVETRKRRKLVINDKVVFSTTQITISDSGT
ncbi:MAG: RNA-binding S4 domain-containing protein [Gammaproteobacteria bacterium]|nr:RNA-binding S4 domain-containing protein [Gammaproteobacteria bacterium]